MRPEDDATFRHGTKTGYERRKCKCDACRAWKREHDRARRKRNKARLASGDTTIQHGTVNTYNKYNCRCEPCADAAATWRRQYREEHGDGLREWHRNWRAENRDKVSRFAADQRERNKERASGDGLPVSLHGATGYSYGCRCGECKAARETYVREWRESKAADDIPHGTKNGFANYGCRCDPCAAANAEKATAWRDQAQVETERTAHKHGYVWTGAELEIVVTRPDLTLAQLARFLGRTRAGVAAARYRATHDPKWIQVVGVSGATIGAEE